LRARGDVLHFIGEALLDQALLAAERENRRMFWAEHGGRTGELRAHRRQMLLEIGDGAAREHGGRVCRPALLLGLDLL